MVWSPARLSLKRRQDYQASFVVCQGWCVRGLLEIYKLEIFDTNCGLVSDARGRLNLYWIEMKLQYMYSALDLWPLGFFASRIGRSEMKCSALEFSYVRWPITRLIFPMYRRWIAHFMETLEQLKSTRHRSFLILNDGCEAIYHSWDYKAFKKWMTTF